MIDERSDNREQRVQLWRLGTALGRAWFKFGNEREKKLFRQHRGTSTSLVHMENLAADLFSQIAAGELTAMGYRLAPSVSDGPIVIPYDSFLEPPTEGWIDGHLAMSGWTYERITVLTRKQLSLSTVRPTPPTAAPIQGSQLNRETRPGRKSSYDFCLSVFRLLDETEPSLMKLSAEKLVGPFRRHYNEFHREAAHEMPAPAVRTLRNHLKRYRSAETG